MTPAQVALAAALAQSGGGVLVLGLGDRPARLAALGLLANVAVGLLLQDRNDWLDPAHRVLVIDAAYLVLLTVLAARAPRAWVITAAALQLLAMMSDAVIIFDHAASARAWLTVTIGFGWGVFVCVLWGGVAGFRRRRSAQGRSRRGAS